MADLLRETVHWLDPEIVVVFGGPYWWAASRAVAGLREQPRPLLQAGFADGRRWVVGWHPNGANRRGRTPGRYTEVICDALQEP